MYYIPVFYEYQTIGVAKHFDALGVFDDREKAIRCALRKMIKKGDMRRVYIENYLENQEEFDLMNSWSIEQWVSFFCDKYIKHGEIDLTKIREMTDKDFHEYCDIKIDVIQHMNE